MLEALETQRQALKEQGLAEADLPFAMVQPKFRTGLVLLHGSAASPCNHRPLGQYLFGQGYSVLAPLLAGHDNLSQLYRGETSWLDCYQSALEAVELLSTHVERLFVLGSSFGGTLAYLLGVEHSELVDGVIAMSAPSVPRQRPFPEGSWMAQIREATSAAEYHLSRLMLPTLVMHGHDDVHVPPSHSLAAFEKIPAQRKKLLFYHGMGHSLGFGFNTAEVVADIQHFIAQSHAPVTVTFRYQGEDCQSVHVAGEFNGWSAEKHPLHYIDGEWRCDLELLPGLYQYKLVLDQQLWILDPEAESADTPHGEANSLCRVS